MDEPASNGAGRSRSNANRPGGESEESAHGIRETPARKRGTPWIG